MLQVTGKRFLMLQPMLSLSFSCALSLLSMVRLWCDHGAMADAAEGKQAGLPGQNGSVFAPLNGLRQFGVTLQGGKDRQVVLKPVPVFLQPGRFLKQKVFRQSVKVTKNSLFLPVCFCRPWIYRLPFSQPREKPLPLPPLQS